MKTAFLKLHIKEKATRRTWVSWWPNPNGERSLTFRTGRRELILHRAGYAEYNSDGEPVLDSWTEPMNYLRVALLT